MPRGTRPGRTLGIRIVRLGGHATFDLKINSNCNAGDLHHAVRKLTGVYDNAFDLVLPCRGAIFGLQKDYGTVEFDRMSTRKLCNLRIRNGCTIIQVINQRELDDDGHEMPVLLSDRDCVARLSARLLLEEVDPKDGVPFTDLLGKEARANLVRTQIACPQSGRGPVNYRMNVIAALLFTACHVGMTGLDDIQL